MWSVWVALYWRCKPGAVELIAGFQHVKLSESQSVAGDAAATGTFEVHFTDVGETNIFSSGALNTL